MWFGCDHVFFRRTSTNSSSCLMPCIIADDRGSVSGFVLLLSVCLTRAPLMTLQPAVLDAFCCLQVKAFNKLLAMTTPSIK